MDQTVYWPLVPVRYPELTSPPMPNGRALADDIFKRIFLNVNIRVVIHFFVKFVPKGLIDNIPALVYMMAWCRIGDQPLSEQMLTRLTEAYMWY